MKHFSIQIPSGGVSVQLTLSQGLPSGQVVIVASDEVQIRQLPDTKGGGAPTSASFDTATRLKLPPGIDLETIHARLWKLRPTKRTAALNAIKTMFQFTTPISESSARLILEELRHRGFLSISAEDKLQMVKPAVRVPDPQQQEPATQSSR